MNNTNHIIDLNDNRCDKKIFESLRFNRYAILRNHPINLKYAMGVKKPDLKEFYQIHFEGLLNQANPHPELIQAQ